ncbi:MAG: hypothetical protein RR573_02870 [Oscillospiraceae bacterium]
MKQGTFFFIADDFFTKHDPDGCLMKNKEGVHNRPCFYAFPDKKEPNIFWCVPISSQIEKFEKIVQNKITKQIAKGYKAPKCNTICFGEVLGQKRAFLIQNMFPVTASYVSAIYMDKNSHNPVTIAPDTEKDITKNAKDILKLVFRGNNNLVFSDIQKTYTNLIAELQATVNALRERLAQSEISRCQMDDSLELDEGL